VESANACPQNRACFWLGPEHDGTNAAYFAGGGGSNGQWVACGTYVYRDAAGWHTARSGWCSSTLFPDLGATGYVFLGIGQTGCVNVRNAPGPTGAVVGCIKTGTSVRLDGGPAYSAMTGTNGLWWHIAGQGWMSDDLLR
jgi:hypothetical protein